MSAFPEIIRKAWENREGYPVLTTVDADGQPNAIYVGSVYTAGTDTVVVADNYFHKTRANILAGCKGSLLFLTREEKAYQFKGTFEYHTSGPVFEQMKRWNPARLPGHAAAVLRVESIFSGAEQLM
jgi:hypothetical protein